MRPLSGRCAAFLIGARMRNLILFLLLLGLLAACHSVQPEPAPQPEPTAEADARASVGASIETLGAG